jgi:hypothetical protein
MRHLLFAVVVAGAACASSNRHAATPPPTTQPIAQAPGQGAGQGPAGAPGLGAERENVAGEMDVTRAPATTGFVFEIEGVEPTLTATATQLQPLGMKVPQSEDVRVKVAAYLGLGDQGHCLDLGRRAGLIADAAGGGFMSGGPSKLAVFFATTSDDDARAATGPATSGRGLEVSSNLGPFLQVADLVPGGIVYASDWDYLDSVRGFVQSELGRPMGGPQMSLTFNMSQLAQQLGTLAASRTGAGTESIDRLVTWMKQVDTAALTYTPDPQAIRVTASLTPAADSHLATLVASNLPSSPPPGALVPDTFPIQATFGLSGDSIDALQALAMPADPQVADIEKQLAALTTGQFQFAVDMAGRQGQPGFAMVAASGYTDSGKAQALLEELAQKSKTIGPLGGLFAGKRSNVNVVLKKGVPVGAMMADELSMDLPRGAMHELIACPANVCIIAVAADEDLAKSNLTSAIAAAQTSAAQTPMLQRPGVKETADLLGDVSRGLVYVDLEQLAGEMQQANGMSTASAAPSGKAGVGMAWTTSGGKIHINLVAPVAVLSDVRGSFQQMEQSPPELNSPPRAPPCRW